MDHVPSYKPLRLGPLPVEAINATLGTELEDGEVYLSSQAHAHIAKDHPADYLAVMQAMAGVIARPTFVGQAPGQTRNMELVGRIQLPAGRGYVLVAVSLERDDRGLYRVRSGYLLEERKVENRRRTGHLVILKR